MEKQEKIEEKKYIKKSDLIFASYKIIYDDMVNTEQLTAFSKKYDMPIDDIKKYAKIYFNFKNELEEIGFDLDEIRLMRKKEKEFKYFCYTVFKKYQNNSSKLNNLGIILNIPSYYFSIYADEYKDDSKLDYSDPYRAMIKKEYYIQNSNKRNRDLIERFIHENNYEVIVNLLNKNPDLYDMRHDLLGYVSNMYPNNIENILENIKAKFIYYRDYLKNEKKVAHETIKKKNEEEKYSLYLNQLLDDEEVMNYEEFCKKYSIKIHEIDKYRKLWNNEKNENGKSISDIINERFSKNKKKYYQKYVTIIQKVLPIVDKDIKVGEITRKFDIVDCYTYFLDTLPNILNTILNNFNDYNYNNKEDKIIIEELAILKNLLRDKLSKTKSINNKDYYYSSNELEEEFINNELNNQRILQIKNNNFNYYHEVTRDEKLKIFNTLRYYRIPINSQTYSLMLKRINSGKIEVITQDNINDYLKLYNEEKSK